LDYHDYKNFGILFEGPKESTVKPKITGCKQGRSQTLASCPKASTQAVEKSQPSSQVAALRLIMLLSQC
jgi:hypothetical protein